MINPIFPDLDIKIVTLATKAELKSKLDKTLKLEAFYSIYFHRKSHFEDNGAKTIFKYFKFLTNGSTVTEWKSKSFLGDSVIIMQKRIKFTQSYILMTGL